MKKPALQLKNSFLQPCKHADVDLEFVSGRRLPPLDAPRKCNNAQLQIDGLRETSPVNSEIAIIYRTVRRIISALLLTSNHVN